MSKVYVAYIAAQNKNYSVFNPNELPEEIGYYSDYFGISESENIKNSLSVIGGLLSAYVFATKKRAKEVSDNWNKSFKENGTYLFD